MELQGKVALLTGATGGIGAQIGEELAKRGADLFITWSPSEAAKERAAKYIERIKGLYPGTAIHGTAVDLSTPTAPAKIIKDLLQHFQHIDILINNAGRLDIRPIAETTVEGYDKLMHVNLRAPFFLTLAAHPHLRAPGDKNDGPSLWP